MESISSELFTILKFLLPGFLTAWIFHAFTAYPKPSQFERVVQALIFTVLVHGVVSVIKPAMFYAGKFYSFGNWTPTSLIVWSYISAVLLGFTFSYFANTDNFHKLLRKIKLTKQTSYHCEWFGAFHAHDENWVVLHLIDDKRIYGWPHEWPSDPTKGHFVLMFPAWLDGQEYVDLPQVESIMFKVSDIKWVEFIHKTPEIKHVQENANTTT